MVARRLERTKAGFSGSRRERSREGKLREEPLPSPLVPGVMPTRQSRVLSRALSAPSAPQVSLLGPSPSQSPAVVGVAVVRAAVQVLPRNVRTRRLRVRERLAAVAADRAHRRRFGRCGLEPRAPQTRPRHRPYGRARGLAGFAARFAARARVAARAREPDATTARELRRRAGRHLGQHALRRRKHVAAAAGD